MITTKSAALNSILKIVYLFLAVFILYSIVSRPRMAFFLVGILVFLIFFFQIKVGIFAYSFYLAFEETILQHIPTDFFLFIKYSGDLLLVVLLLAVFTKLAMRRYNLSAIKKNPINIALIVFLFLGILSMLINEVPVVLGIAGLRQLLRYIVLYLVLLVICSSSEEWSPETTKILLKVFLVLVIIQTGIGYLQLIFGPGSTLNHFLAPGKAAVYYEGVRIGSRYSTADMKGLYGTFLNRNTYGLFLMCGSLLILGLLHEVKESNRRTIYALYFLAVIPCLLFSYSRQSIYALILGGLIIMLMKRNFKLSSLLVICVAGFLIYSKGYIKSMAVIDPGRVTVAERMASPFKSTYIERSLKFQRLAVVKAFMPKLLPSKYMLLGLGPGAFGSSTGLFFRYLEGYKKLGININSPSMIRLIRLTGDVGYLALFGQYGILGLLAIMWIYLSLFLRLRRKYLNMEDEFLKGITLGFLAYIIVFAITWSVGINIEIRQISYYFWMIAALLVSLPDQTIGETADAG